ncbi:sensor histidine kinase N-terminal domain-containing protein [Trinickia caryophylli]|uniref:histidine kinase n=1 Tax=Trinickia caryophylli TaxID=28094 RepID=A0A1X7GSL9_TRICW|nr:sensor histidine kinase [Trinickia caryophylli]PMS10570.1 sensor histidine kinase [Trinickia caryophylli]TRX19035.1 HAMP domain-containing protein [Trinickia caryophylli]WQE10166.1 sensor histidine kinase N-terminal domain-containing protein [Trinickia caryophylli]SMF73641.1 Signal transduction histidine kinase [Trinickia caryophylli]GLU35189.1 two-component system sensor kinase [Trinickia caryophylli]
MPPAAATSLRRSLLRRLAGPLSLLALMSGLMAYWLAWQYTQHVIDRSLADLATALSKQVQIAGPDARFTVPPLAQAMFSDPPQHLIYRINDGERDVAGDSELPLSGMSVRRTRYALIFEARHRDMLVRVAQVRMTMANGKTTLVEVAQPLRHRYRIAAEFLVALMMPLLLLLLAGWGIVWRVVNQQLGPLTSLADSLNRQTHMSLEPVDETHVPLEIRPLTSALNALLDRLKTALDAQRKFIADAAHQLRTPLTAVKLHAEQAATAREPAQTLAAVRELRSAADRAVRLSNQLLSLARAEPGAQAARFTDVDIAAIAFETGAEWVPRALAAHVDLGFQRLDDPANDTPLIVRGNAVLLREVIANLLDNALKYVPSARVDSARVTVTVGLSRAPNGLSMAEVVVEDNGRGVPVELQADLFKRFFRGDRQDADNGVDAGAGLGLAIVHDILTLHGGTVLYADAPDGGARFIAQIPLAPAPANDGGGEPAPAAKALAGQHDAAKGSSSAAAHPATSEHPG